MLKRTMGVGLLSIMALMVFAQKPSLTLKAYKRFHVSGRAPAVIAETGEKVVVKNPEPTYLLYLVANKIPYIRIDRIWINQELYLGKMEKITAKPVISEKEFGKDTLVKYTDEAVWQIVITGKPETKIKPKKDIETLVANNELVLRLFDKKGVLFTRTAKNIKLLESSGGQ